MWLAIDIGNSSIKGGLFTSNSLEEVFRITGSYNDGDDHCREQLLRHLEGRRIERAGVASVVPQLTTIVTTILEERLELSPVLMRTSMPAPIRMHYETPDTLGVDRFAAAVGGFSEYGEKDGTAKDVIVVDAGTAITYEVIDHTGCYLGGMISPGPAVLQDSLIRETAQLSKVPLEFPRDPIGRSTAEALQAGLMSSCVDGINGAIKRLTDTLDRRPVVVMTGGWTERLAPHLSDIDHIDPHLVLKGIYLLMQHAEAQEHE